MAVAVFGEEDIFSCRFGKLEDCMGECQSNIVSVKCHDSEEMSRLAVILFDLIVPVIKLSTLGHAVLARE